MAAGLSDVRFTANSGHQLSALGGPLSAKSGILPGPFARPFLTGAGTLIQPHGLPGRDRALDGVSRF